MKALALFIIIMSMVIGILFHEFGHMVAAKKAGVEVRMFCIGMGKPIFKHVGKDGVTYGIAPLPFGGYCDVNDTELEKSSLGNYTRVMLAGVFNNFMLGIVLSVLGYAVLHGLNNFSIVDAITQSFQLLGQLLQELGNILGSMFNVKELAESGGIISGLSAGGSAIAAQTTGVAQNISVSLSIGGMMNYVLAFSNLLPIPAIDGGQLIIHYICVAIKKFCNREVPKKLIARVNTFVYVFLMGYQAFVLLLDVPFIRNGVLWFFS